MKWYILVDIDNTLSNAKHREDLIAEHGWEAYHSASGHDEPIEDTVNLIQALNMAGFTIICLTGRNERYRQLTAAWLLQHNVMMHDIWMRPDDDFRPSAEVKLALAREQFHNDDASIRNNVAFIIDDQEAVLQAFRGIGVNTLHVALP